MCGRCWQPCGGKSRLEGFGQFWSAVRFLRLDSELHRYVRTARLFDVRNPIYSDKLPELLDVRLMAMSPRAFMLAGFERAAGVEIANH